MGGKKKGILRNVVEKSRGGFEGATESLGLGKGLGRTIFTASSAGLAQEGVAMGEDMVRAPSIAKAEAKKAANMQSKEQSRLLGAAKRQEVEEGAVAAATEDLAKKKQKQNSRGSGRQSTILTSGNILGNSGDGKTLLGV